MKISPFQALRPKNGLEKQIASLPYDVMDSKEAAAMAAGNPKCFLHVVRSEIDLDPALDPHDEAVYVQARLNLDALVANGDLVRENAASFYIYRQTLGGHSQTAVVACCEIDDYAGGTILRHEKTRKDKEDDRFNHILSTNANTGQVFLAYRECAAINWLVESECKAAPLYDFTADDSVRHTVWRAVKTAAIEQAFHAVPKAYIADGHHRSAASFRAGMKRRDDAAASAAGADPAAEYNRFMACLFPASQLAVLPYNRLVKDLNGLTEEAFLAQAASRFAMTDADSPAPAGACSCAFYIGGKWRKLSWELTDAQKADPVSALDVARLQDDLLAPVLGIADPRTDPRIYFSGGIRGTGELEQAVDSGAAAVAFSMFPTAVDQVMSIADAGQIMPPKSTWFEPKLRSGLLIHTLD